MPINLGLVAHLASLKWWNTLDPKTRTFLEPHLRPLEVSIIEQAKSETPRGINCDTGTGPCSKGPPASMKLVPATAADDALRKEALVNAILTALAQRCGAECVTYWNSTIGKSLNIKIGS